MELQSFPRPPPSPVLPGLLGLYGGKKAVFGHLSCFVRRLDIGEGASDGLVYVMISVAHVSLTIGVAYPVIRRRRPICSRALPFSLSLG